jgi:glycosyltransferase involved in cell wall biosynthesis
VATVGKMAAGRGHEEAIAAAAPLLEVTAVHVGHGERMPMLKRWAAELGAGDRNVWTGYQEEFLPDLYRCWNAFLFTASGSEQGQRAILEAMASGLPIVALDLPGVRDLVTDGREGFVVQNGVELTDRLGRLVASPDLRAEMSASARERARDFTAEKFAAQAREFYEQVVGRRKVVVNY